MESNLKKIEFGDFQTPVGLSEMMMEILLEKKVCPDIVIEPTCGYGNILLAAHGRLSPRKSFGIEINPEYVKQLALAVKSNNDICVIQGDIFQSLEMIRQYLPSGGVCLFVGNPPWVTNSGLSVIDGTNLPVKENIKDFRGIEAITGKSNFDISESIILKLINQFRESKIFIAFLCKNVVARNILKWCWDNGIQYRYAEIYPINSKQYFNAAVDACFFLMDMTERKNVRECGVYDSIENRRLVSTLGYHKNRMIVDINKFISHNYLGSCDYIWRNGIKHDCSKTMELDIVGGVLKNGYDEIVDIETEILYPLLKSSDLVKDCVTPRKMVVVTQKKVGDETNSLKHYCPKGWKYLNDHAGDFDKRKSSIYKNKPKYSIFSVGDYSFYPYKIAISALYKRIRFVLLSPVGKKPVMVDDTCNYISFDNEAEARLVLRLLESDEATDFLNSIIFWDSKRPITAEVLNSIDLLRISHDLGVEAQYVTLCAKRVKAKGNNGVLMGQGSLFD
jgi:hypothetical protein